MTELLADTRQPNPWRANLDHSSRTRGHDNPDAVGHPLLDIASLFIISPMMAGRHDQTTPLSTSPYSASCKNNDR